MKVLVYGVAEPLRRAADEAEFEDVLARLATRGFVAQLLELAVDPVFLRAMTSGDQSGAPREAPPPRDQAAWELFEDFLERYLLLGKSLGLSNQMDFGTARKAIRTVRKVVRKAEGVDLLARMLVVTIGLLAAARGDDRWESWIVGALWNAGRRAVLAMANGGGLSWEQAADALTTKRDRALLAKPFDPAGSERALRLLGLHSEHQ